VTRSTVAIVLAILITFIALGRIWLIKGLSREQGWTSLHNAAAHQTAAEVKFFIERSSDVNEKDDSGNAPIHLARNWEIAKVLLDAGAKVNLKGAEGNTPLHIAAIKGDERLMELLIARGADVNLRNDQGATPLFDAVTSVNSANCTRILLAKGAKANVYDRYGASPAKIAKLNGNIMVLKILEKSQQ